MEPEWSRRIAEVLSELNTTQLMMAKERALTAMVQVVAQEITSDLSGLMAMIEGRDRRAAAFEKVLNELKKLKSI